MAFIDLARERYSERRFDPNRAIEPEKLDQILEAGRLAPTACNCQPQRILIVQSPEGLAKVDKATRCRFGAPCVAVLAYDMKEAARNPDFVDFGPVDTSIVATHMMMEAADLGVHSCWVGLVDPSELRRQFDIPSTHRIISIMDLGYPGEHSRPAPLHSASRPLEETVSFETFAKPEG